MINIKAFNTPSKFHIKEIINAYINDSYNDISGTYDHWKMVYLFQGKLSITSGNKIFELKKGSIAILAPERFHCIRDVNNTQYFLVEFKTEGNALSMPEGTVVALSDWEQQLINMIYAQSSDISDSLAYQELRAMLELLFIRCRAKDKPSPIPTEKDAVLFSKAVDILQQNIPIQLSVSQLAENLDISLSHLKRIFARYTLIGVHEYFTTLKISRAKQLLKEGISVTKTAELAGFSNQAYFSAAFKKITGISPKEFAGDIKLPRTSDFNSASKQVLDKELPSYLL